VPSKRDETLLGGRAKIYIDIYRERLI